MTGTYCWKAREWQIIRCSVYCVWFWGYVKREYQPPTPKGAPEKVLRASGLNTMPQTIKQGWPNSGSRVASVRLTSLILPAKYLAHFFHAPHFRLWTAVQHHLLLPVLNKSINKVMWFYCTTIYCSKLFLHRLRKSHCFRPSSCLAIANSSLGSKSLATLAIE